jgi:hypothetical protein
MGTVTDVNADAIPNATVVLKEVESNDPRTIVATEKGMFQLKDVTPSITYQLSISAKDFAGWTSRPVIVSPGQFKIVTGIQCELQPGAPQELGGTVGPPTLARCVHKERRDRCPK